MTFAGLRSLINRYRVGLQDLSLVLAAMLVAAFVAFEFDIFADEGSASPRQQRIDLDEVLLLAGLLAVGLLGFAARRYFEQRREMRRRIAAERRARELAYKDPLTGVANRRQFDEALSAAAAALPRAGAVHAVMLLDLNGFKRVNDNYGHGVGDEALIIVAQRLLAAVRDGDLVARFGGDEFAIIALHLMGAQAAANIALRAIHALDEPVVVGDVAHQLGAGIGVALLPRDARTPGEALRMADVALYRAKVVRRSAMRFYEEDMDRLVHEREMMEQALRAALASGDIRPVFKPSVDLRTKAIVGMEAVPQWIHATARRNPARALPADRRRCGRDPRPCRGSAPRRLPCRRRLARFGDSVDRRLSGPAQRPRPRGPRHRHPRRGRAAAAAPADRDHRERPRRRPRRRPRHARRPARGGRQHRSRQFRHRLFEPLSSAQLQARQDQDRSELHHRHDLRGGERHDRRRPRRPCPRPRPDDRGRRDHRQRPAQLPPRHRLRRRPGVPLQQPAHRRRGDEARRRAADRRRDRGHRGADRRLRRPAGSLRSTVRSRRRTARRD
ncbi:MAG: diguanylate cyclase [Bauldia sp.]|nr:MAG: diguanylate cyclase [Bauldia sp.]